LSPEELKGRLIKGRGAGPLDLSRLNLLGADLSSLDLRGALLMGADLSGSNLSGSDLTGANLTLANLTHANLRGADLSFAHLEGAALHGCDLRGANLKGAYASHAVLAGCEWSGVTLKRLPRLSAPGAPRARRLCTLSGHHALALEWGAHLPPEARALPPLIALHGALGRPAELSALASLMGREVIALELLGHGERPCVTPEGAPLPTFEALADHMGDLVAAAADGRPFWLFGYSLGGRVALSMALSGVLLGARADGRPRRLLGLCALGASAGIEGDEVGARQRSDEAWAARLEGEEGLIEVLSDWSAQPLLARWGEAQPEAARALIASRAAQPRRALAWAMRAWSVARMRPRWSDLSALSVPTLWLYGAEDARYAALAARAAALCPRGSAQGVAGAGHAAHLEAPEGVAARLLAFMAQGEGP
jgi:2-succinyl-6-hydroxy-2,4-cyclohexadiene-1-carboxylate synthase